MKQFKKSEVFMITKWRTLTFIIILLIGLAGISWSLTYTVDDDGTADYTDIQSAINAAVPGDIVFVYPGTYAGGITLEDGVTLNGSGPDITVIDGQGFHDSVVTYSGTSEAVISGFRITGSRFGKWTTGGIYCSSGSIKISNNIITGTDNGIAIGNATASIVNNTIVENDNGIIMGPPVYMSNDFNIAYIYDTDLSGANSFKNLLDNEGLSTTLIPLSELGSVRLSPYRMIIVGSDTGSGYSWGSPDAKDVLFGSNKPVLGIGNGGASMFQEMGLSMNYGHAMGITTDSGVLVPDPNQKIFIMPHRITVPGTGIVDLYTGPLFGRGMYAPSLDPGVQLLASSISYTNHFILTKEKEHGFWGYTGSPASMTDDGQLLFLNFVHDIGTIPFPSLPDPQIYIESSEEISTTRIKFNIKVKNWYAYPDELFVHSPDLPPCGANDSAARTDVEILDQDGNYIYGFCAKYSGLESGVWFSCDKTAIPESVYLELTDRRYGIQYISNKISPLDIPDDYMIMNNIITSNNQAGIFFYNYVPNGQIKYNDVWDNPIRDYHNNMGGVSFSPVPGTGSISADPEFEDSDFHLAEGSPCIDAGHPGAMYNDQDGTRNDMGAYGGLLSFSGLGDFSGSGFVFTSIGKIPTSEITKDTLDPAFGLANVSNKIATDYKIPQYTDSPFGGVLWLHGMFGNLDNVDYYRILVAKWNGNTPPDSSDYVTLNRKLTKVQYHPQPDGSVEWEYVSLGPKTISGIDDVYYLTDSGYWSHIDLRMIWNTNSWDNGKYTLKYKAYSVTSIIPLSITEVSPSSNELDHITIIVDNTPVDAEIYQVKYDSGTIIPECGIIEINDMSENLKFDIKAWHPNGYLKNYRLDVQYGRNKYAGYIVEDQYVGSNDGSPPIWYGVDLLEVHSAPAMSAGYLDPWNNCAYTFRLKVWARTTDGFGYIKYREFNDHYYIKIGSRCATCY